jgi:hypothetical protein
LASLTNTGSKYNGVVSLQSVGGSGTYRFDISSLPAGWTAQANAITIPNIVNLKGTYTIKAKVTDLKTGTTI